MHKKLHKFELAALANLCPETAEEVRKSDKQMEGKLIFPLKFLCVDLVGSLAAFVNSDHQPERLYLGVDWFVCLFSVWNKLRKVGDGGGII